MNKFINKFNKKYKKYGIEIITQNSKLNINEKVRLKVLIKYITLLNIIN